MARGVVEFLGELEIDAVGGFRAIERQVRDAIFYFDD
jgi:hypothetical protein